MPGPFVHRIDPVLAEVGRLYLWWYGLCYALGFLAIHAWLRVNRRRLGLSLSAVYDLSLFFTFGVLLGGRTVEVFFYEWPFYSTHPHLIPAYWLGGMATHGLLLGAVAGTFLFCRTHRLSFLSVADELVIPGAFLLGVGRMGNFIDGQIVGRFTDAWWGVQFPDADGFRHPVVLYDGVKNLLLIPLLLAVRRRRLVPGMVMAHFVFWYGFLRIFVDIFREYPTRLLGIGTGQSLNLVMALLGGAMLVWLPRRSRDTAATGEPQPAQSSPGHALWLKQAVFGFLLVLSLTMPSDWTQDIPARYGRRHPGLRYAALYPRIRTAKAAKE
ncbi:MAG: prolipoprotein diacylglyceryl transferase [Kiritimatiellae bacterium]|nr:prolipoprotein diacylglyceryl transferase [Kiritimatiellia bacterium]